MAVKPLFKWAGSKRKMLQAYENTVMSPSKIRCKTFVDMFAGSGVMAMWAYQNRELLGLERIILNDTNKGLINLFMRIKKEPYKLIAEAELLQQSYLQSGSSKEDRRVIFNAWRSEYNAGKSSPVRMAALMLCILHTGFNGIWRTNRNGELNVPIGDGDETGPFLNTDAIWEFNEMLQMTTVTCRSYEDLKIADPSTTFFYADPPYISSCHKYEATNFNEEGTQKLIDFLDQRKHEGAIIAMSNSDHPIFTALQKIEKFDVRYAMSSKGGHNKAVEILWHNL